MRDVFTSVLIVAYRRVRNLGDLLVHGKTNRVVRAHTVSGDDVPGCKKECVVCDMFERGIHNTQPGTVDIKASKQMQRCGTWNVVDGITCTVCKKFMFEKHLEP